VSARAALLAVFLVAPAHAVTCEELRSSIEARIAAGGVARFSVAVVEAAQPAPGRVVGSCDMGRRKIVYLQEVAPAGAKVPPRDPPMLTECRDGSVRMGGDCRR